MGKQQSTAVDAKGWHEDQGEVETSIVVPVFNESENVGPLTEELTEVLDSKDAGQFGPYEIVFVDDGSTDGTPERLAALVSENDRVRAVFLSRNFGQSAALAAGIDHVAGARLVTMDGDRQNDPADIPRLLDELESGYDCVKGWRKDRQDPWRKTIPSALQTRLAWLTGPKIHDYVCGIAAYRTAAIRDVALYGDCHRYIPAMLHERGYRVSEVEVNHRARPVGRSKYGPRRLLGGFVDLLFFAYWTRFAKRPVQGLGGASVGVLLATAGLVILTVIATTSGLVSSLEALIAVSAIAITGIVTASVLFVGSLLAETATRRYYRRARPYRVETVVSEPEPGGEVGLESTSEDSGRDEHPAPEASDVGGGTGGSTSADRDQVGGEGS